jgi:hypothetical protein
MTYIFLSYARNDDETFARRLHADLTGASFDMWFDRVSPPSRQLTFHQKIRDAIAAGNRLLLVADSCAGAVNSLEQAQCPPQHAHSGYLSARPLKT